nr:hypothetical protein [Tanacetum cinerariifolium]
TPLDLAPNRIELNQASHSWNEPNLRSSKSHQRFDDEALGATEDELDEDDEIDDEFPSDEE